MENQKSSGFSERFNELIFKLGKNQSTFATSIGVSHTSINKVIKGETQPRYLVLDSILKAYPQVNRDWLLEGKGEMFKSNDSQPQKPDEYLQNYLSRLESEFSEMRQFFQNQLEAKDRQIEFLMGQLGKFDGVTEETQTRSLWPEHWAEA